MLIEVTQIFKTKFRLFLKHEGVNPTGTQKDRIAIRHVCKAKLLGASRVVAASCGNFGVSLSYYGKLYRVPVTIFVPSSYESPRISEILDLGAELVRPDCSYEECVELSSAYAAEKNFYNANPLHVNRDLEYSGYGQILREILLELNSKDLQVAYLCVPVSNGVTLAGLYYESLLENVNITFVAGSCISNPVITSVTSGKYRDLEKLLQQETEINEPLINWRSFDGENACQAILATGGFGLSFSDEQLAECAEFLNKNIREVSTHPAATAGLLAGLTGLEKTKLSEGKACVALITSKNY